MAFGFPAHHEQDVALPHPITHDWVAYTCNASGFGQPIPSQGPYGWTWRFASGVSLTSWGEDLTVTAFEPARIRVTSRCSLPTQCFDWGKNETNVQRFIHTLLSAMHGVQAPPFRG